MTLNEAIAADVDLVLDLDDFAETVTVEGTPIKAQIDSKPLGELAERTELGIAQETVVMYVRTSDLPTQRKAGDALMVGPFDWTVIAWEDRGGVTAVTMQRTR